MKLQRVANLNSVSLSLLLLGAVSLSGCGSSSSSSGPGVSEGRIVETAITGLSYSTETQSGITGTNGTFDYLPGETVTFSVGELEIAALTAKSTINWFELGGLSSTPVGAREVEAIVYDEDLDGDGIYNGPSLTRVGAIASLLVTLDEDRNSANGIVIDNLVSERITHDVDLQFDYTTETRFNASFRRVLRAAVADGLLSAREPRNGALEVAALYDRMGIDPELKSATRFTSDNNADGIIDWVRTLTYHPDTARVMRDEYDTTGDGLINNVNTLAYTAEINGDLYTTDIGNDGIEKTRDWEYDAFGDLVRYEEIRDGTLYQVETRELDPLTGLYIRREVINPVTGIHTIETWTMDSDGNRPFATIDNDGDGAPENNVTLRYDEPNSLWTYREDDTTGDGVAEVITTRQYDATGNLTQLQRDNDANGTFDHVQENVYNAGNRLVRQTVDTNNDGNLETLKEWQRNARGNVLSSRQLTDGVTTYSDVSTYDSAGNRLTYSVDRDGDGAFDDAFSSTFDADNNLLETTTDLGADGSIDRTETRSYDTNGRMIERHYDSNADGNSENSTFNTYNADGLFESGQQFRNGVLQSTSTSENYVDTSIVSQF